MMCTVYTKNSRIATKYRLGVSREPSDPEDWASNDGSPTKMQVVGSDAVCSNVLSLIRVRPSESPSGELKV